jgi:hypothetical protein
MDDGTGGAHDPAELPDAASYVWRMAPFFDNAWRTSRSRSAVWAVLAVNSVERQFISSGRFLPRCICRGSGGT